MLTSRPARIWLLALAIGLAALPAADHFAESFLVPEPTSPLYYQFVLVAGDELEIDRDGSIDGNLHANDEIEIDRDTVVDGNVSATDEIENDGTISGEVLEGAAALTLPGVDPDFFLDRADRVFDDDVVFEDAVIDDVVYVDGDVKIKGSLDGTGTLFATGEIKIKKGDGVTLDGSTRLALIALEEIEVSKNRPLRGLLRSCEDVKLKRNVDFEGVLLADGEIEVQRHAMITFLELDQLAPEITLVTPGDGSIVTTPTPEIEVALADELSGLVIGSLEVLLDGVDLTDQVSLTETGFRLTPEPLEDGLHTLEVAVRDVAGNEARQTFTFTVALVDDPDAPRLFIISPFAAQVPANTPLELVLKYDDVGTGIDPASLQVLVDTVDLSGSCVAGPGNATCALPALAAGDHTVDASVADRVGNQAAASRTFTAATVNDIGLPLIDITEPDGRPLPAGSQPQIVVGISDPDSGVDLSSLVITLDGTPLTADCSLSSIVAICPSPSLDVGQHTLAVTVSDLVGNTANASLSFAVEDLANLPDLTFITPAAGSTFDLSPQVTVQYAPTARPLDLTRFDLLADTVTVVEDCVIGATDATCVAPVFEAGTHTLEARIADATGLERRVTQVIEVLIDDVPPVVTILTPVNGSGQSQAEVEVSGTVTDDVGITEVLVGGEAAVLDGDTFRRTVTLVDGDNYLGVEALDVAGNRGVAEAVVRFPADLTPPELRITSLEAGAFVASLRPPIDLVYRDESDLDLDGLTITADGQPLLADCQLGPGSGACTLLEDLPEGAVELAAGLSDVFGNAATATLGITVDTVDLQVAIDEPLTGLITAVDSLRVSGTVGAAGASVVVEVNGVAASVAGGAFSAIVPLREGRNMLVALAIKANGNTGTASVDVTRDVQPPIVRIDSPRDGLVAIRDVVTVTGLVNDIVNGGRDATVTVNGLDAAVAGGTFMLPDLPLVPGPNRIEVVGVDAAGNEGRHEILVTFTPPVGQRLVEVSGGGQLAEVNSELGAPIVVQVVDALGQPVAGRPVRFEVIRNNGQLTPEGGGAGGRDLRVVTDGSGRAAVRWTLGDTRGEGNQRVRAKALGVAGEVVFCASALAGEPARVLMVNGDNQRGAAGRPLPAPLEAMVVDRNGNPLPGVGVDFEIAAGGGNLDGTQSAVRFTDAGGVARAVLTLGTAPGVNNHAVRASVIDVQTLPATFVASTLLPGPPGDTRLSGTVLDNTQNPIPNALVEIVGSGENVRTDAAGRFAFPSVPAGLLLLHVDPADSPRPESFPPLEMEIVTVAGQANILSQPIELPALDSASARIVGGDEDVTLVMEGVEGLTLTVLANSATFPDGSTTGLLSISQVHLDKVPMPPPNGSLFMPPAWTIQPAGVTFDPPAKITIPNDGLPPGRVIDVFQFDHPTNTFINVGKAAVSDDGFLIVSDDGFGITRSGWGGCGLPPPPPTCTDACEECKECDESTGRCEEKPGAEPSFPPPVMSSAGGEVALISKEYRSLFKRLPFVDATVEVSVGGEVESEIKPVCCQGEKLFPGSTKLAGSVRGNLSVELSSSPIPTLDFERMPTIFGVTVELQAKVKITPYVRFGISLVGQVSGKRDLCDGTDCLEVVGCAVFPVEMGGEASFLFEIEIGSFDIIDDDFFRGKAKIFAEGNGSIGGQIINTCGANEGKACIGEITGNLEFELTKFISASISVELFGGFGDCCG